MMTSDTAKRFPWAAALGRIVWPDRPARRKRWVVAAGALLLVVAIHTAWVSLASNRLLRATERVAESWGPMAPASVTPPPVPDADNAAKPVSAASEMLSIPERAVGANRGATVQDFGSYLGQEPEPEDLVAMRRVVTDNAITIALLDEAVGRARANWNLRYRNGAQVEIPNLRQILDMAKLNVATGRIALRDGDLDGVVQALARGAAIERSLAHEPILIIQMVRTGVQRIHVALLREWLIAGPVDEPHLRQAAGILVDPEEGVQMPSAFIAEAKAMLDVALGSDGRSVASWSDSRSDGVLAASLAWLVKPVVIDNVRVYLELMEQVTQCAAQPRFERTAECDEDALTNRLGGYHAFAKTMVFNFSASLARTDMVAARQRMAAVALAVERHRLRSGHYPESLDDLLVHDDDGVAAADRIERSALVDPLTGGRFAYERTDSGFHLTSTGVEDASAAAGSPRGSGTDRDAVLDWRISIREAE